MACLRVLGLWRSFLDSMPSTVMVQVQIANIAITSVVSIFFFGTLIRRIEQFTGVPPFAEDAFTDEQLDIPKNKWTFLASVYFIFVTTSTVGYGDMTPKTIPGQLFTIVIIMCGIAGFSYVCSEMMAAYQLSSTGQGEYSVKRRTRHIIVSGSPTSQMLADFINEVYHEDHTKESKDLEVVVLVSAQGNLMDAMRNFLRRKANVHIKNRVTVLQGSVLDAYDLMRVRLYAAVTVFMLPNMYVPDPVQDDTENIMRVMSIRREAPRVRIICLLHKAEHRQLLLSGGAAESDVICLDEFKLGLLAKTCQIPAFSTLVCNLCKTIAGEGESSIGERTWRNFYESGLGHELYEVELSVTYRNRRFADVVVDILERSEGASYLIGIVEEALQIGDAAILRVYPGRNFKIRDDRRCYGIFISQDRDAIVQQKVGEDAMSELVSQSPAAQATSGMQAQQLASQLGSSLFSPLEGEGQLPNTVPDPVQQNVPGSSDPIWSKDTGESMRAYEDMLADRAKSIAAKHVAQRLWQRRVLPKGDIEELLNVKLPEEDPDPELTEMDGEEDLLADAKEMMKGMGPLTGRGGGPQVIATHSHEMSQQQQFEALRVGFAKIRTPKEPPPGLLAKGGHILFCTLNSRGEDMKKKDTLGKRLGFEYFLKPLRSSLVQHPRPIVVLAPLIPADWYTTATFSDIYFMQGSPISPFDLSRTSFELAHAIVVHQPGTAEGVYDPMMVDSDVIFAARLIESQLPHAGYRPPVLVDLMFDVNHTFVPLHGGEADDATGAGTGEGKPLIQASKSLSLESAMGGTQSQGAMPGKFNFAAAQKPPAASSQSSADKIDEAMGQQMEDTGFYKQQRFACGSLFVSSTVTSLVVNSMYNPSLAMLIKELVSAHFLLVTVPVECHGWTYKEFFEQLLRDRDLMSLAIVRRTDAVVPEDEDQIQNPLINKAWGKSAVVHRYVQTAPTADSRIVFDDQILCVPPNTNECAVKNPIQAKNHPFHVATGRQ
eukprot:gnl/MRDRNA2_/MRDRNA2_99437_c0_seq1.p1 gnl/MRDRNA2_/MRDRNA2_99437_c0~~gnl/MRDRNA2_/MRDRNA2_99437_c0_seq1.p1  ORF type:complete len:1164 (-),score=201.24 gnl/MRDRNA2_/MRDRNA2_99437_c0_seq1:86-3076(-)